MNTAEAAKGFVREHALHLLLILIIPGFSLWFFGYAEDKYDGQMLASIERSIDRSNADEATKLNTRRFFQSTPVSQIMASTAPDSIQLQRNFDSAKIDYSMFRWAKLIAKTCLGAVLATFVLVGISVFFSLRGNRAQYWSLRLAWPVLRTSAIIQILGQAVLALGLSYWVTAIIFDVYVVKLIAVIGMLGAYAIWALMKAMLHKVDIKSGAEGCLLAEADAPALWQRVRERAALLATAPPDQIIVGIAPSFYVTEHPVQLNDKAYHGRTLFLSLPMLKILGIDEADAILGHELGHFSGEDTLWGRKISPLLGKFSAYLQILSQGIAMPVAMFLGIFWDLYMLSIRKLSREREFRADRIGSEITAPGAMARALIKVSGYCDYRAKTEKELVDHDRLHAELRLAERLQSGFPDFFAAFTTNEKAVYSEIPHPFDTHPPLNQRLESLGVIPTEALKEETLRNSVSNTWWDDMPTAASLDAQMWAERERLIQEFHSKDLAWRLIPEGPEEEALVLAHFPPKTFAKKDGAKASLSYDQIHLAEWAAPILFKNIVTAVVENDSKKLDVDHRPDGGDKVVSVKFYAQDFIGDDGDLLAMFGHYYSRYRTAVLRREMKAEADAKAQADKT